LFCCPPSPVTLNAPSPKERVFCTGSAPGEEARKGPPRSQCISWKCDGGWDDGFLGFQEEDLEAFRVVFEGGEGDGDGWEIWDDSETIL
jgi:hypothetical protein